MLWFSRSRWVPQGAVRYSACVLVWLGVSPVGALATVQFTDVTREAGIEYVQYVPDENGRCITDPDPFSCEVEWMSGGAAVADVDDDGHPDLYVTRLHAPDILYRNLGNGRFQDVSGDAGLADFDLRSNGASFGDFDNDGDSDLYVTTFGRGDDPVNGRFHLFVNDGNGRFSEEAVERNADIPSDDPRAGYSIAIGDYDRDGWLDIHTTEWRTTSTRPGMLSHARLLRNIGANAPGHFEDVTVAAGVETDRSVACHLGIRGCEARSFSSTFTDLDEDGWPDIAVASDFGTSVLFWNNGDGTFTDGTRAAGVGTDENGMGSAFGDFDADGDLDWFVTSIHDPDATCGQVGCGWGTSGNRLFRNEGGRRFTDATDEAGVRDGAWGWGAVFLDFDNDGDLDLSMTNGVDFPGIDIESRYVDDPMRLFENDGTGGMIEVAERRGLRDRGSGKGLLTFDYDRDGDLDLFVVNTAGEPVLYRNDGGNRRGSLRVRALLTNGRDALGARVELLTRSYRRWQVREIGTNSHFLGQSEAVAHFGLGRRGPGRRGRDRIARVRVTWPNGTVSEQRVFRRTERLVMIQPSLGCGTVPVVEAGLICLLVHVRKKRRAAQ